MYSEDEDHGRFFSTERESFQIEGKGLGVAPSAMEMVRVYMLDRRARKDRILGNCDGDQTGSREPTRRANTGERGAHVPDLGF